MEGRRNKKPERCPRPRKYSAEDDPHTRMASSDERSRTIESVHIVPYLKSYEVSRRSDHQLIHKLDHARRHAEPLSVVESLLPDERGNYGNIECQVVPHLGYGWASAINASAPVFKGCTNVALFLDDVKPVRLDPDGMLRSMQTYDLHVASPTVLGASWRHMAQKKSAGCVSRVDMVEYFATFFSERGWDCFYHMISRDTVKTATSAIGWGYDLCQGAFCPGLGFGVVHEYFALYTKNPHKWSYPLGRRLTLRSIPKRRQQEASIRRWVRIHMNSTCHEPDRVHKSRLCAE